MKKTKVLFMINNLKYGGAEKVLINLVNNMNHNKYDITLMTIFDVGVNRQFLCKEVEYKFIYKKQYRGNIHIFKLFSPEKLYKKYVREEYDVVIAYLEGVCTRIVGGCTNPKTKTMAWVHSAESEADFTQCYRSLDEALKTYGRVDYVAAVSDSVLDNIKTLTKNQIKNSGVVYNTNETEKIRELSKEEVMNPLFDYAGLKIICVGRLRPEKGFMRLAKIHKKLVDEGYKYKIFILGEGEEKGKLENYLKEEGLEDSFILLGYDTNPYKYVAKSDLFVCSSFVEGFSTATTESLIVGTPVLTTLCPGMVEMLGENNEYGVIVENTEEGLCSGIRNFLEDKGKLEYYRKKALERSDRFSTSVTVGQVQDLIDEIVAK